jgi:predicted enzyme related to lactoylglutathione lyase
MADRICHVTIPSLDLTESMEFYGTLFGWTFVPNTERYILFNDGEQGLGGGFSLDRSVSADTGAVLFIHVDRLDAKLAMLVQLGGQVVLSRSPIGQQNSGYGWYAIFSDPHGNRLGLYTENLV